MFEWPYFPGAISGTLLFIAGLRAFDCWRELRTREPAAFWGLAAVGLFYLALDEWFEAHERLALWLFPDLGIVNHLVRDHHGVWPHSDGHRCALL